MSSELPRGIHASLPVEARLVMTLKLINGHLFLRARQTYCDRFLSKVPFGRNVSRAMDQRGQLNGDGDHGVGQLLQLSAPENGCIHREYVQ